MSERTTEQESRNDGPSAHPRLYLLVMAPDRFQTIPIQEYAQVTIGRAPEADVRVDDPMVSRVHVRIHVGANLEVEDLGSVNGVRVRGERVTGRVQVQLGEAITLGSTVVIVQRRLHESPTSRLWSHAYFVARLEEACESRQAFAVLRLSLPEGAKWETVVPAIAASLDDPRHTLAGYGPNEYELLLPELSPGPAHALVAALAERLSEIGVSPRTGLALYPIDGSSPERLIDIANRRLAATNGSDGALALPTYGVAMKRAYDLARRVAPTSISVLILGETGVGKEVIASFIHKSSERASQPLLAINCAGLSESLIESELFGHEKGAFTGATNSKHGLLESANGGTVFLDEIGELSLNNQAKLLRVIETREVFPLGATRPRPIDVRFISATNRELEDEVSRRRFRQDLFFRLSGVCIQLPPLRERTDEIEALAELFLIEGGRNYNRKVPRMSAEVRQLIREYSWPGNIRELRNVFDRALVVCDDDVLRPEHLSVSPTRSMRPVAVAPGAGQPSENELDSIRRSTLEAVASDERQRIMEAMVRHGGNQSRAARALGISRGTLINRLIVYGIPRPRKTGVY